jgi:hypothetical protein
MGSIRPRSLNDQITALTFGGVQKYYDGSVALYISYLVCLLFSNPKVSSKFLFDLIK